MRAHVALAPLLLAAGCLSDVPPIPPGADRGAESSIFVLNSPTPPPSGAHLRLSDVVVLAQDTYDETGDGRVGTVYVAEPEGGQRSGIQLFAASVVPAGKVLSPGDVARVTGDFVLFEGPPGSTPFDRPLPQLGIGTVVQKSGEWIEPQPLDVTVEELLANGWDYTGSLVRVGNVTSSSEYTRSPPRFTTEDGLTVASSLYQEHAVTVGTRFESITGVFTYFYDFQILPRRPQDMVIDLSSPVHEANAALCSNGRDDDANGATDCDEPSCAGVGGCP